ncbi:MAG: DNA recombination protein RmuC [Actinomycetota bacterium]
MVLLLVLAVILAAALGVAIGWFLAGRGAAQAAAEAAADTAAATAARISAETVETLRAEQHENLRSAVDTVMSVASSKLGDQLAAGKMVIDRERDSVATQVATVESELRRVGDLVSSLQKERAEQSGQLSTGLEQAMQVTSALADTTRSLREALASPKARGQWGERMAEDVLRAAGFLEGTSYVKQTKRAGGGLPDYTFPLPTGHVVNMDVKFPIDNYLRWLEAQDDAGRAQFAKAFRRDVRDRVKELTERCYVDPSETVDYLLLFVPNESVYGFLHEQDPDLIDFALTRKVVLCSPTTLFAVLAVIRHAVDNFMVEQRSHDILGALGELRVQWERWDEPLDKMKRGLDSAQRAYDDLTGARKRGFERQLEKLEAFRDGGLPDTRLGPSQSLRQVI